MYRWVSISHHAKCKKKTVFIFNINFQFGPVLNTKYDENDNKKYVLLTYTKQIKHIYYIKYAFHSIYLHIKKYIYILILCTYIIYSVLKIEQNKH